MTPSHNTPAVIYTRVSTHKQAESMDALLAQEEEKMGRNMRELVRVYSEPSLSGQRALCAQENRRYIARIALQARWIRRNRNASNG